MQHLQYTVQNEKLWLYKVRKYTVGTFAVTNAVDNFESQESSAQSELTVTDKTCHISNNNKTILTEIEAASSGKLKSVETDKICTACEEKTVGN